MYDSSISNYNSSMESSMSSSMASSVTEQNSRFRRRRGCNIESDPSAEISRFDIRIASLAVLILHEEILTLSNDSRLLLQSSVHQLQKIASEFFKKLGLFAIAGYGSKDFDAAKQSFEQACNLNHIRYVDLLFYIKTLLIFF